MQGKVNNVSWLVYDILKAITGTQPSLPNREMRTCVMMEPFVFSRPAQYFYSVGALLQEVDTLDHLVDVLSRGEQIDWLRVRIAIVWYCGGGGGGGGDIYALGSP